MYIFNPFEQFIIVPLIITPYFNITNAQICLFFILFIILNLSFLLNKFEIILSPQTGIPLWADRKQVANSFAIPTKLENQIFVAYLAIQSIIENHIHIKYYQQRFFPIIFNLVIFLFFLNMMGNLPFFMSLTSQFAIISAFCLPTIFGIFLLFVRTRGITFLRTFYAPGTGIFLAMMLFPIELLTYFMRPISIIARLCANIMSGHVIVKVCLQTIFSITKFSAVNTFFLSLAVSLLIIQLIPLLLLEVCVSIIQVYVFLVIFCMFLSDTFGHHFRH